MPNHIISSVKSNKMEMTILKTSFSDTIWVISVWADARIHLLYPPNFHWMPPVKPPVKRRPESRDGISSETVYKTTKDGFIHDNKQS